MPYGYDKTRTERRCKDCNKLLYVFETGEFCIECSRKQAKTWSVSLQTRWIEKNYDRTRNTTKKAIPNASWIGKGIPCLHVRKIPEPATMWWLSCRIRSWSKNFHGNRRWIHCVLRMQAQQGWNREVWRNPQFAMNLFRRKKEIVISGTICKLCVMEFSAPDRMVKHILKAHGKPKKNKGSSCPNCWSL